MKRILTATILIVVVFALIFLGQQWMLILAAALVAELAAWEYLHLANASGTRIPVWWMLPATALLFLVTYFRPTEAQLPVLSALALVLLAWSGFRAPLTRVLPDAALGLFGLIYIAYPLTLIPLIWDRDDGKPLLLFLMVAVCGRAISQRSMWGAAWAGTNSRRLARIRPGREVSPRWWEALGLDWRSSTRETCFPRAVTPSCTSLSQSGSPSYWRRLSMLRLSLEIYSNRPSSVAPK